MGEPMQLMLWQSALSSGREVTHVEVRSPSADAPEEFPGMEDLSAVGEWLSARLAQPVGLHLTDNRTTMVSYRRFQQGVRISLHRIFLQARAAHMEALVAFVKGDRQASRVLDEFVSEFGHEAGAPLPFPVRTAGQVHDLASIFAQVNAIYFHDACKATITWAAPKTARGKRALRVGLYLRIHRVICIHPCLDQDFVPRYYVAWVVFQEMLQELFGLGVLHGRSVRPPPEFAVLQSCHPDFSRCSAWETEHWPRLAQFKASHRRDRGVVKLPRKLPN